MIHFIDIAEIKLISGKGGDGTTSFLHEMYNPQGGPDGGDGGNGGNVIIRSDKKRNHFQELFKNKELKSEDGKPGKNRRRTGKRGKDLIIKVPIGTQVFNEKTNKLVFDFTEDLEEYVLLFGGKGGYGNAHFTSSVRQKPAFHEFGEPGESGEFRFELKVLADVGIIGLPNAGKSTFISSISNSKPKIANYPFTTLIPNFGTVERFSERFLFADVPGLISGASSGKGLGIEFLRHIERCSVLIHMIDVNSDDPFLDFKIIDNELKKFSEKKSSNDVYKKKRIIVFNKIDYFQEKNLDSLKSLISDEVISKIKKSEKSEKKVFFISAVSKKGIDDLLDHVFEITRKEKSEILVQRKKIKKELTPKMRVIDESFLINEEKSPDPEKKLFKVSGQKIEKFAIRTNFQNIQAVARFRDILNKMGIEKELLKKQIKHGDIIQVLDNKIIY